MTNDHGTITERALEIAVEARTLARAAHDRQDSMDDQVAAIRREIADFKATVSTEFTTVREALARLNVKAGMAAAGGAAIASAAAAAVLHYFS